MKQIQTKYSRTFFGISLFVLVLAAFIIRSYGIDSIPPGLYPDEAVNGTDAIAARETGEYKWFYPNNNGREGLYINLVSLSTSWFGNTIFGLKFWSILAGALTVLGAYLLAKELFASRGVALISAFLLTFSYWSINFSRIGFRAILLPLLLTFSFYWVFKGLRTKKYLPFILGGLSFGLAFHTYIAIRIAPAILIVLFIALLIMKRDVIRTYWKHALVFLASAFFAAAPLLVDFYLHPEYVSSRSGSISVFSPDWNEGKPLQKLGETFALSLGKYFVWGDQNWRHNFPPYPILNPVVSITFAIGLLYALWKCIFHIKERITSKKRSRDFIIYSFLLSWFFLMLAPEFLTAEGIPHALRAIGTMPAVYILAALPIVWLWRKADIYPRIAYAMPLLLVFLAFIGLFNTVKYFNFWGQTPEAHSAFDESYSQMAHHLNAIPQSFNKYVVPNGSGQLMDDGFPVSADVIQYLTHRKSRVEILNDKSVIQTPAIIVLMRHDEYIIQRVEQFFPGAHVQTIQPTQTSSFTTITIQ